MAIALDLANTAQSTTATSLTFSHTCTGSNLILFVTATIHLTAGETITSITYNGIGMTKLGESGAAATVPVALWMLMAPPTGAHNVVITVSSSTTIVGISTSYTGVSQTGQPDVSSILALTGTVNNFSQSVTTVANNCWAIFGGIFTSAAGITAGANTVVRNQPEVFLAGTFVLDTGSPKTPAGTDTVAVTSSSSAQFAGVMASFAPIPPNVNSSFLAFM